MALAKKDNLEVNEYPVIFQDLKVLLANIADETISNKQAKDIFLRMWDKGEKAQDIIDNEGVKQISDINELNKIVDNILKNHYKSVEEYKAGKDKLFGFFVGQIMKETQGKANPKIVNKLLKDRLKND